MDPNLEIFLLCAMLGSIVGVLAGLLGIGGGLLIVPAMVFLLHFFLQIDIEIGMPIAVATSLSTVIMTGLSSARSHYKLGNLDKRIITYALLVLRLVQPWVRSLLVLYQVSYFSVFLLCWLF
jgi:uncharacterized membrane protein YfcA